MLIIPDQMFKSLIPRRSRLCVELLQAFAEIVVEPGVGPAIARRLGGCVMEWQQALRVREGALDLTNLGGGEEKDFGLDVRGLDLAVLYLRRMLPESGGLSEPVVFHDQPGGV